MCSMYFVHTTAIVHNAHSYKFAMVNFCINNQRTISYLEAYIAKSPTAQDTFWPIAGLSMYKHVNSSVMCRLNASLDGHFLFASFPGPTKMRLLIFMTQHAHKLFQQYRECYGSSSFHEHACHRSWLWLAMTTITAYFPNACSTTIPSFKIGKEDCMYKGGYCKFHCMSKKYMYIIFTSV